MLNITKTSSPEFYTDYIKKNKLKNWNGFDNKVKNLLRKYILESEQNLKKNFYCTYCEREIDLNKSHIDHIKPKGNPKYKNLEFDYSNFTASCNYHNTCGSYKVNNYDEKAIHPVDDDPIKFVNYNFDGTITAKEEIHKERVDITIDLYNLNESALKEARNSVYLQLYEYGEQLKEFIDDLIQDFQFPNLLLEYKIYLET